MAVQFVTLGDDGGRRWLHLIHCAINGDLTIRFGRCAIPRYMPCLTALVADLACRIKGAAIGSCAVARNMALHGLDLKLTNYFPKSTHQLAACIAFHSLRLTVTSVVVWSTTLVACCRTWTTSTSRKASAKTAGESATGRNSSPTCTECRSGLKACIWARSLSITVSENDRIRDAGVRTAR